MRATYLLPCQCGARQRVISAQAGETIHCTQCQTVLQVPALRELGRLEPADPPRPARCARWSSRKLWMLLGVYAAAAALLALLILWINRPQPPDPSQLSPLDSWKMWMALRQGLNRQVSSYTYELIEAQRNHRLYVYLSCGFVVAGLAISLVAFLARRRRTTF